MHMKAVGLAALIATAGLGMSQIAHGQQGAAPPMTQQQPAQATPEVDDAKLDSFVVAFLEVDRIGKQYAPRIQQAQSPDEQAKMREEAGKAMLEAVESQQGITVEEYNSIVEQAQSNPELANRINTKLQTPAQ